jgi:hypothetical protein
MKTRTEQHGKIGTGDVVRIKGEKRGIFVVEWIDGFEGDRPAEVTVIGGSMGRKAWRTFTEEKVTKASKKAQVTRNG